MQTYEILPNMTLCCLQGKFSSRSDVWSFAVTLWELLTFARCQPFSEFDDEQVIENCRQFYLKSGDSIDDEPRLGSSSSRGSISSSRPALPPTELPSRDLRLDVGMLEFERLAEAFLSRDPRVPPE